MNLTTSSPVIVTNLTSPRTVISGQIIRREGRQVEISVGISLPIGASISIETESSLQLGYVVALSSAGVVEVGIKQSCWVHLDQSLDLSKCHWPDWVSPKSARASSKHEAVLVS